MSFDTQFGNTLVEQASSLFVGRAKAHPTKNADYRFFVKLIGAACLDYLALEGNTSC